MLFSDPASALVQAEARSLNRLSITELRGREAVLASAPMLALLAARCDQLGAVDYLEYFLTGPYVGAKTPCVFFVRSIDCIKSAPDLDEGDVYGAVLMYEYRVRGFRTKIFSTDDEVGERTVLAPPIGRPLIAAAVAENLIRRGASLVFMSIGSEGHRVAEAMESPLEHRGNTPMWTARERRVRRYFPLQSTYDETLATLGKHTRRNLRAFRRRAEAELQARFVPVAELSLDEVVSLNRLCSYPVPDRVAVWRYQTATEMRGGFLLGVRSGDGRWLSLLGGRRHHGTTEVAWQMNREGLDAFSLGTVMRSYLIQNEIAMGSKRLFFEGGTPHSMQSAFTSNCVVDLLVSRSSFGAAVLRFCAPKFLPTKNMISEMLCNPQLAWGTHTLDAGLPRVREPMTDEM